METSLLDLKPEELERLEPQEFVDHVRELFAYNSNLPVTQRRSDADRTLASMLAYTSHPRFAKLSPIGVLFVLMKGYENTDESDVFDFIEEAGEYLESIENHDENGRWNMTDNLSPELLKLFGKAQSTELIPKDWQAPAIHGLANSKPLMETNFYRNETQLTVDELYALNPAEFVSIARDTFALNSALVDDEDILAANTVLFLSLKSYVLREVANNEKSVFGLLAETLQNTDDDNFDEEVWDVIGEYLDDLDDAIEDLDNMNADSYEIMDNMSSNLKSLFGQTQLMSYTTEANTTTEAWVPPSASGLGNSKPIVKFKSGANSLFDSYEVIDFEDLEDDDDDDDDDEEDYDEEDEDDYDEEEGDEDDEEEEYVPSGNMSASLMMALGLSTEGMAPVETDWKPPEVTGLTEDGKVRAAGGRGRG